MGDNLLGKKLAPVASLAHTILGKCFATNPFAKDKVLNADNESGKFSVKSNETIDTEVLEELNLPILGAAMEDVGVNYHPLSSTDLKRISKDAAALCQYVYLDDPLRPPENTMYHTATFQDSMGLNGWISFRHLQKESARSRSELFNRYTMLNKLFNGLNDYFHEGNTFLERRRTGFNSDIYMYMKDGSVWLVAYVTGGSRPLTSIKTKKGGLWDGIVDWTGDWLLSDILQGFTGISPQYTLAIQNSKKILKVCDALSLDLIFVGHSLGGGLAVSNAIGTNRPAIVFDMAGLNLLRLLKNKTNYDDLLRNKRVLSYYLEGELLSTGFWTFVGLKHNGNRHKIAYDKSGNSLMDKVIGNDTHAITHICRIFGLKESFGSKNESQILIKNNQPFAYEGRLC